jgi:hypothetical protein
MPRRLETEPFGCWVVKANPETWDYFAAREDDGFVPGTVFSNGWTVSTNYRSRMMGPDDLIILWVTGRTRSGIHEIGRVTSTAYEVGGMDPDYAVDVVRAHRPTLAVDFESSLLEPFLPRADLLEGPVLSGCEQVTMPLVSNPTYLTTDEVDALGKLLAGRVDGAIARDLGWDRVIG